MRPILTTLLPTAGLVCLLSASWAQDEPGPRPEAGRDRPRAEQPGRDALEAPERARVEMERVQAETRELEERGNVLRRELEETAARLPRLRAAGDREGAAEMERQLRGRKEELAALRQRLAELRQGRPEREPRREAPEIKERVRDLQQLRREAAAARERGHPEEAEQLMAKARELSRALRQIAPDMPLPEPGPGPRPGSVPEPEALERRIHHLAIAIDNLHAAGLHEPAERLAGELEANRRELENLLRERRPGPGAGPRSGELAEVVERLRAEVSELREIAGKLSARVEELERRVAAPAR